MLSEQEKPYNERKGYLVYTEGGGEGQRAKKIQVMRMRAILDRVDTDKTSPVKQTKSLILTRDRQSDNYGTDK